MAGHIYFSMMKHVENLCESDIVHSLNYYYNQLIPQQMHIIKYKSHKSLENSYVFWHQGAIIRELQIQRSISATHQCCIALPRSMCGAYIIFIFV